MFSTSDSNVVTPNHGNPENRGEPFSEGPIVMQKNVLTLSKIIF